MKEAVGTRGTLSKNDQSGLCSGRTPACGDEDKLLPKWQVTAQSGPQGMNLAGFLEREKDDTARLCSAAKNSRS